MKLLASDFDGTFYINEEGIKENVKWLDKFIKNNLFVIATGRTYYDIKKEIDKYGIKCSYLIINHGASILENDEIIFNSSINNNVKNKLISDLMIKKSKRLVCASKKESRVDITCDDLTKIYISYKNKIFSKMVTLILFAKYNKYLNIISYKDTIEIVAKNVNKKEAINFIKDRENLKKENILTIGDNLNDIEMVKEFNGFTVENSIKSIKKAAIKEYKTVKDLMIDIENDK